MTALGIGFLIPVLWLGLSAAFYDSGYKGRYTDEFDEERTKNNINLIALINNIRDGELESPKLFLTPLQKEIRDEERAIKQLKKQKVDMQRLEALKQEHEKMFEDEGSKRHRLIDPKVWAELDSAIYENYRVMVDDVYKERARIECNDVWSEPDESDGDISADPTTMPDSVNSPHECPECNMKTRVYYLDPTIKYRYYCYNCDMWV